MSKGPLNYATTIDPSKTAAECIAILAAHKASRISMDLENGNPVGLAFAIDTPAGLRYYLLPANTSGAYLALKDAWKKGLIQPLYTERDHAARVAWRVLKDWLEAQLALIDMQMVEIEQVMLPYLVVDDDGTTVWQRYLDSGRRAISGGDKANPRSLSSHTGPAGHMTWRISASSGLLPGLRSQPPSRAA